MGKYAYSLGARILWVGIYVTIYYMVVPSKALWLWAFLPFHFIMTPLQGIVINWFAHKIGYRSFDVTDTSTNLMPFDLITMGEGYHNNHHAHSGNANFSQKWYETDLSYPAIALFDTIRIIKLVKTK